MSGLLIKDFPPEWHRRLKEEAARYHRSMTRQHKNSLKSMIVVDANILIYSLIECDYSSQIVVLRNRCRLANRLAMPA